MPSRSMKPCWSGIRARVMRHTLSKAHCIVVATPLQGLGGTSLSRPVHGGRAWQGGTAMALDEGKLNEMLGKFVTDLGATIAAGGVVIGDKLGLYKALAPAPATAAELADRTGTKERYVTEWLRAQAAGGYVEVRRGDRLVLDVRGAGVRADRPRWRGLRAGGVPAGARLAEGRAARSPRRSRPVRAWAGTSTTRTSSAAASGSSGPGYIGNLVPSWMPSLEGVEAKLQAGARVADVGLRARRVDDPAGADLP